MRIDDAILSGSVIGSDAVVSLSGSFTGSGFITSASFAITASHALGGGDKKYPTQTLSANFNFTKDTYHIVDTTNVTGTLPATPNNGDRVGLLNLGTSNPLVARNGSNIMALAQDLEVDSENASFQLVYSDAANGWIFVGANN